MYAKVIKKNRNSKSNDSNKISSNPHKENRFSCEMVSNRDIIEVEALYSSEPELTLDNKQDHNPNNIQIANTPGYESIGPSRSIEPRAEDMNYEKVQKKSSISNKDLKNSTECVNDSKGDTDPGYASIKNERRLQPNNDDCGYEKVDLSKNDPGYEQIVSRTEIPHLEPNYASISRNRFKRPISQCSGSEIGYLSISSDPSDSGYERVASRVPIPIDIDPKYASIERKNRRRDTKYIDDHLQPTEPNYESMPCRSTEGSESDPNYESVHYFPNIKQEPPYHLLENDRSSQSQNEERGSLLNNNNVIQDYIETNSEPGYEQIGSNKTLTYSDNSNIKL